MREISRLKPIAPSGGKPFVPWAIGVSTIAVIFLMVGIGNQYLSRFQKPYSFDATSEMRVELIEAPVVLNLASKPDVRTQLGGSAASNKNNGAGQQPDEVLFAAAPIDEAEEMTVADAAERYITLSADATIEKGRTLGARNFHFQQNQYDFYSCKCQYPWQRS